MKSLYRHKLSGDIFAIETDEQGNILSTAGPLLCKDIDPEKIDYDNWNAKIQADFMQDGTNQPSLQSLNRPFNWRVLI